MAAVCGDAGRCVPVPPAVTCGNSSVICGFNRRRFQPGIASRTTPRRTCFAKATRSTQVVHQGDGVVKTLAIKLENGSHAQLTAIAQLEGQPVTALIKQAVEEFIESKRHQPQLTDRAEAMLEEIERDAAARQRSARHPFRVER